jgi:predicted DNA-binding protein with PD1-like motif
MHTHVLRLTPGQDLKRELDSFVEGSRWTAAVVLTCVGSLTTAVLRFADRDEPEVLAGPFEILSLCGTLGAIGGSHLHLAVSDGEGRTKGGHLKQGSLVRTTAELVLGRLDAWRFERQLDPATGYPELVPSPASP